MLTNFKSWVKEYQSDIVLTLGIILVALASFGIGRLTAPQSDNEPIIIQEPVASAERSLPLETERETTKEGEFVGSVNSNKYHWPDCPWAKKIASQNQIWFSSEEEAQAAGYVRCGYFEKYAP